MSTRHRTRSLAAAFAIAIASLVLTAAPAHADTTGDRAASAESCWLNGVTGKLQCFDDDTARQDAVQAQTDGVLIEEGSALAARPSAALRASYIVLRVYDGGSYTGGNTIVTHSSSTVCTTGPGLTGNFPAGWNDVVSSYHSYFSCTTRIYQNINQGGTYVGYAADLASLGALDNQGSSYQLT